MDDQTQPIPVLNYPTHPVYARGPVPPQYLPPRPPKDNKPWLVAAVVTAAVLLVAGALTAGLTVVSKSGEKMRERKVALDTVVPATTEVAAPQAQSGSDTPTGLTTRQVQYLMRLGESGIKVFDSALALHDGQAACDVMTEGGDMKAAIDQTQRVNESMGELGAIITVVVSIQELCPQNSPFKPTGVTPSSPLPVGMDGEFIRRLRGMGIGVSDYPAAVGDARKVCVTMADQSNPSRFLDAAQQVNAANPRITRPGAVVFTILAMQVYCVPAE